MQFITTGDSSDEGRDHLAGIPHRPDSNITLESEHAQALGALTHAQEAVGRLNKIILEEASAIYPNDWHRLLPAPVSLATWVGYDLDGRTDISWADTIRFRLEEKLRQVEHHLSNLRAVHLQHSFPDGASAILDDLERLLATESEVVRSQIDAFSNDLESPDHLSSAANLLTRDKVAGLGNSITPAVEKLAEAMALTSGGELMALAQLRAEFKCRGLGPARIHIRINAMQLHNAIRKPLGMDSDTDVESRVLLKRLDQLTTKLSPETVNFASLSVERTTAIRQFIVIAQILKHIDKDAPIRLLIAECEHAFSVLAALYFARLFGVAGNVDISPLFETHDALEHGASIIESLFKTVSFRQYVATRKRLSIQTGYSDAGRFIGQIPAALAVERLQGQLANVVETSGLSDIGVLIFDTHGESMGRGAHPSSFRDRIDYVLSPWVRERYRRKGIALLHETSIQGGDGYVFFGSADLAFSCLANTLEARLGVSNTEEEDAFYTGYSFTRDYFERVREYQIRLFEMPIYGAALGVFGTNLLVNSGSRKAKRQFDTAGDERSAPAQMRAIPHNALMQQLGYPVNVIAGLGTALWHERERFGEIHAHSDRTKRLIWLVAHARRLSSIKTLVAYASLFDDAYWVTRPLHDLEPHIKDACLHLADLLRGDTRHDAMMHLATYLREDAVHLHDLIRAIGEDPLEARLAERSELDVLHAIRIALIQHIFLLAARFPPFSTRNDISQDSIMGLVLRLRVEEAAALLRDAFPQRMPSPSDFSVQEPATYTGYEASDYAELNRELIDPMLTAYQTVLDVSVGISHHFGAHG
ncbi:phosphoenolpyruvate carboxylase [bacterium MnTg02]|nr:phosphoenolpyruvate carboxylase [bacterium MnTg02]